MSIKVDFNTAQGLLKQALNEEIVSLKDILPDYSQYIDQKAIQKKDLQFDLDKLDAAAAPNVAQYLAVAQKKDSSNLAAMGGGCLPQIMRIFRDIRYTTCDRKARLLGGIRGQLIKAKTNIQLGGAFI